MRIVFMGTPEFAIPSLKILLKNKYEVTAVVTAPDKPRGRGQRMAAPPVKEFAARSKLLILQPLSVKDPSFITQLQSIAPDLIVVVAFRILPPEVLSIPKFGSINLHASLLPKYRGAAPIHWAIINGEKETGVTTFFLEEKVDAGNVILQARTYIAEDETAGELRDRLAEIGAEILLQTVRLVELGKASPRPQNDSLATPAPKINREMCRIDWMRPTRDIHNFVRGLSPDPCAYTSHNGRILNIYRTKISELDETGVAPGQVVRRTKSELAVATRDGAISIEEIQLEGKKRMGIEEFLRGYRIEKGDRLG